MAWQVFYSYSHEDEGLRTKLGTYLKPLVLNQKIVEWYDRKIEPGADWDTEISNRLDSANLILLLVSESFLASEYCFGVEVERALTRLKRGEARVVPILLKPCLWQESRFSQLQIIPRDGKAITSQASPDEAFGQVANELRELVSGPPPASPEPLSTKERAEQFQSSLNLVRNQIRSYAGLYERVRQRMRPSDERTQRMTEVLLKMRDLATASYPLLDELAASPSPGDRLAAIAILQVFASEKYLPLLVKLVGEEKPFVVYQAATAIRFAVGALEPRAFPELRTAIADSITALKAAKVGLDTDRMRLLREAEAELAATTASLALPSPNYT